MEIQQVGGSTNDAGKVGHTYKKSLYSDLTLDIGIPWRWTIDLNLKCKTIQLLEDNIENLGGLLSFIMTFKI